MILTNLSAEQTIIGCCLQGQILLDRISSLKPEHFAAESHREAFSVIKESWAKGVPTDPVLLDTMLTAHQSNSEGLAYWVECANSGYSTAMLPAHIRVVRDNAQRRALLATADKIAAMVHNGGDINEHVASASALVGNLLEREIRKGPRLLLDVLRDHLPEMGERWGGRQDGLKTGFTDLDIMLGGLRPGNLILIAARPAMGKTSLAMQIGTHVASSGVVVAFSQEMADTELADRLLASAGRIPLSTIVAGGLSSEEHNRFAAALGRLSPLRLYIDDQPAQRLSDIRAKALSIRRRNEIALIVVDYLQLMSGDDARKPSSNRNAEIEQISRGLKALAKELACPVIALSQLNRDLEKRPNKRPVLSDLRDSGAIEQDADVVLMIYRDEVYNPESPDKGIAEILIRKHRQGQTGTVRLKWRGELTSFGNCTHQDAPQAAQPRYKRGFDE
tara:strand:+ start:15307 stop:16647 length:1341 start_codon:yes stop_codon:yes gene_type:complete